MPHPVEMKMAVLRQLCAIGGPAVRANDMFMVVLAHITTLGPRQAWCNVAVDCTHAGRLTGKFLAKMSPTSPITKYSNEILLCRPHQWCGAVTDLSADGRGLYGLGFVVASGVWSHDLLA